MSNPTLGGHNDLKKTQDYLRAHNLYDILTSLPPSRSLRFHVTPNANFPKVLLGSRKQSNSSQEAEVWAYIKPPWCKLKVPVEIWDELPVQHGERQAWPRPTASVLRKAVNLYIPFRFLEYIPGLTRVRSAEMREMLCAVVLYYVLVAGISEEALRWQGFCEMLGKAMRWIKSNPAYQEWDDDQQTETEVDSEAEPDLEIITVRKSRESSAVQRVIRRPLKNLRTAIVSSCERVLGSGAGHPLGPQNHDGNGIPDITNQNDYMSNDVGIYDELVCKASLVPLQRTSELQDEPEGSESIWPPTTDPSRLAIHRAAPVGLQPPTAPAFVEDHMDLDGDLHTDEVSTSEQTKPSTAATGQISPIIGTLDNNLTTSVRDLPTDNQQVFELAREENNARSDSPHESKLQSEKISRRDLPVPNGNTRQSPVVIKSSPNPRRSVVPSWAIREDVTAAISIRLRRYQEDIPPWALRESDMVPGVRSYCNFLNPYGSFVHDPSKTRLGEFFPGELQDLSTHIDAFAIKQHRVKSLEADRNLRSRLGMKLPRHGQAS
jgi:hypothetical protein